MSGSENKAVDTVSLVKKNPEEIGFGCRPCEIGTFFNEWKIGIRFEN